MAKLFKKTKINKEKKELNKRRMRFLNWLNRTGNIYMGCLDEIERAIVKID
jgi:hypothetical protein